MPKKISPEDTLIINKLSYLVHEEKVSRKELAKVLGYKHPDYITHLIRGIRRLPDKKKVYLDEFFERARNKAVIVVREIIPGEFKGEEKQIRALVEAAKETSVNELLEEISRAAEEIKESEEGETPGLYYFETFLSRDSRERIKEYYKGKDEILFGVYNVTEMQHLLAAYLITMQFGVNSKQYTSKVLEIIYQLQGEGFIK